MRLSIIYSERISKLGKRFPRQPKFRIIGQSHVISGFSNFERAARRADRQYCQAAAGYVELGMFFEANMELDKIDPFNRAAPEVLAMRIEIYRGLEKWQLMQELARRLADFQPDDIQWTISLAYATRRADSIQAAKEILLNAEPKFPKAAAIKYNLGCYFCQTGDLKTAKNYLKKAFEIDLNLRMAALEDEDLKPLWQSL